MPSNGARGQGSVRIRLGLCTLTCCLKLRKREVVALAAVTHLSAPPVFAYVAPLLSIAGGGPASAICTDIGPEEVQVCNGTPGRLHAWDQMNKRGSVHATLCD